MLHRFMPFLLPIVLIVAGLKGLQLAYEEAAPAYGASRWPATEGEIISVDLAPAGGDHGKDQWKPVIRYHYRVAKKPHEGATFTYPGNIVGTRKTLEPVLDQYALGSRVTVRYDPEQPSLSCLRVKGNYGRAGGIAGISLLLFSVAAWWIRRIRESLREN